MTAEEIASKACKGNNFMTPTIIGYESIDDNTACEISRGEWVWKPIYGVTVCRYEDRRYWVVHEKSKMCFSRKEVDEYIESLKVGEA